MEPPAIHTAKDADRERVVATLLLGFASDPLTRWFWPEPSTYLQAAPGFDAFGGNAVSAMPDTTRAML